MWAKAKIEADTDTETDVNGINETDAVKAEIEEDLEKAKAKTQEVDDGQEEEEDDDPPTPMERFKWEVALILGLKDKVEKVGWGGLSAVETGRIGGYMTKLSLKAGGVEAWLEERDIDWRIPVEMKKSKKGRIKKRKRLEEMGEQIRAKLKKVDNRVAERG